MKLWHFSFIFVEGIIFFNNLKIRCKCLFVKEIMDKCIFRFSFCFGIIKNLSTQNGLCVPFLVPFSLASKQQRQQRRRRPLREAAAIQSLQNLQQCSIKRLRPTEAEARRVRGRFLNVVVVSSDGLEKEGKGLSWLSLSLRPRQAPALLTFQPASRP